MMGFNTTALWINERQNSKLLIALKYRGPPGRATQESTPQDSNSELELKRSSFGSQKGVTLARFC